MEMVSCLYERRVLVYSINNDKFLSSLIVNEGSYSDASSIRVGKVGSNSYARIEEIIPSSDYIQFSTEKKHSQSKDENRSEELYDAFKSEVQNTNKQEISGTGGWLQTK